MSASSGIPSYEWINDVAVSVDGTVFAAGASDDIYVSTDGGNSWTPTLTFGMAATSLGCNAQGEVFAGRGDRVYKSTNGGASWSSAILPSVQFICDIAFDEPAPAGARSGANTTIYVATGTPSGFGSQGVWRSTDNGATWSAFNTGLTNLNVTSVAVGPQPGPPCRISCGTNGGGLFDLDESAVSFLPGWVPSVVVPNNAVIKEVRRSLRRQLAELYDWLDDTGDCSDAALKETLAEVQTIHEILGLGDALAGGESVVLVGTNGAGILREDSGATDVAEVQAPREGLITQNDPNPFISRTQIRFAIEHAAPVSLRVYDVRGREVETLVDEFRYSGTYDVTWDAKDRPSGVYFYRLTAGEYAQTQKMILLK